MICAIVEIVPSAAIVNTTGVSGYSSELLEQNQAQFEKLISPLLGYDSLIVRSAACAEPSCSLLLLLLLLFARVR